MDPSVSVHDDLDELWSSDAVAEFAGVTARTVRSAFGRGEFPNGVRVAEGRGHPKIRIPKRDAIAWATTRHQPAPPAVAALPAQPATPAEAELSYSELVQALDRARIVELEKQIVELERDHALDHVQRLEQENRQLRTQLAALAAAFTPLAPREDH